MKKQKAEKNKDNKKSKVREEKPKSGEEEVIEEEQESIWERAKSKIDALSSEQIIVLVLQVIFSMHAVILLIRYLWCFFRLDYKIISNSVFYILPFCILPFAVWICSTSIEYWNFRNRKMFFLKFYTVNALLTASQSIYSVLWKLIIPVILKLKPNQVLTESMITWMCRMGVFLPLALLDGFILYTIFHMMNTEEGKEKLYRFKLNSIIDTRKNKGYLYDLSHVVRDIHTGDNVVLQEEDLKTGILLNGVSGTGKTSSAITPMIRDVMDQKVKNKIARHKAIAGMLKKEKAYIPYYFPNFNERALSEEGFLEKTVVPTEDGTEEFRDILLKYKNAGITVMAPNNGYIRDVLKLAKARKIRVNVLDPSHDWSKDFPETVVNKKLNPFYIPENLSEKDRNILINNRARVFSEVIVSINEQSKEGDVYFRDINLAMTTNIATVVMAAKYMMGQQTELLEIQACIDNPELLRPYIATIEEKRGKVKASAITGRANASSNAANNFDHANTKREIENTARALAEDDSSIRPVAEGESHFGDDEKKAPSKAELAAYQDVNEVVERNREDSLLRSIQFIKDEVLSEKGKEKMFDQSRGLRNLLSINLVSDARITEILSAHNKEELLNFDKILSDGEITVVNTAVEFSSGLSTAFGLFFQLNFRTAVYRRNSNDKTKPNPPHYLIIDEVSQYVNDFYNDVVSFYRQYNIISCLSIQSLTQLASKAKTKHLETLFQGIGTHILYGRLSQKEMDIYQNLCGEKFKEMVQYSTVQNSLLSNNPNISRSERITPTREAAISGTSMRYRNFQEVTLLTTKNGDVLLPIEGKVSFVPKSAFNDVKYPIIHWEKFVPESAAPIDYMPEDENFLVEDMNSPEAIKAMKEIVCEYMEELTDDAKERMFAKEEEIHRVMAKEIQAMKLSDALNKPLENMTGEDLAYLFGVTANPEEAANDENRI